MTHLSSPQPCPYPAAAAKDYSLGSGDRLVLSPRSSTILSRPSHASNARTTVHDRLAGAVLARPSGRLDRVPTAISRIGRVQAWLDGKNFFSLPRRETDHRVTTSDATIVATSSIPIPIPIDHCPPLFAFLRHCSSKKVTKSTPRFTGSPRFFWTTGRHRSSRP